MRPLSRAQIERYVAADAPLDCAGSYKLEARGITLFERIASADHTAIVGLPLIARDVDARFARVPDPLNRGYIEVDFAFSASGPERVSTTFFSYHARYPRRMKYRAAIIAPRIMIHPATTP